MKLAKDRISLVVCTLNRSDLLEACLASIERQTLPPARFEVLIVDNNSTDSTKQVAERFAARNDNFRYFLESNQGLSHARNRGWREAVGNYVGYIDDDSKAPPQWLQVASNIIADASPSIFGGPYYAMYDRPKPRWFKDDYESRSLGPAPRMLAHDEFVFGTNFFVRRELLAGLGGFDCNFGMEGTSIGYGEETRFVIDARRHIPGLAVYYNPDLYVFHLVAGHKMSLTKTGYRCLIGGRCSDRVFRQGHNASNGRPLRSLAKLVFRSLHFLADCTLGGFLRDRGSSPFWQNYVYEHSFRFLEQAAAGYEEFVTSIRLR